MDDDWGYGGGPIRLVGNKLHMVDLPPVRILSGSEGQSLGSREEVKPKLITQNHVSGLLGKKGNTYNMCGYICIII